MGLDGLLPRWRAFCGSVRFLASGWICWVVLFGSMVFCANEEAEEAEENAPQWVFEQRFPDAGEAEPGEEEASEASEEGSGTDDVEDSEKGEDDEGGKEDNEKEKLTLPQGFDAVAGTWGAREKGGPLFLAPEPLVEARVEFGPEQREEPATIVARASGSMLRPLRPRMGVGLYGANGFQLRLAGETDRAELVRRGEVLAHAPCDWEEEVIFLFELSVEAESGNWLVSGRIWREGEDRPENPLIRVKAWADELLFPLAGRPALVATAFSGAPVHFHGVKVSGPDYDPAWLEESDGKEGEGSEEEEADSE